MTVSSPPLPEPVLVVCLCAQWCGTCREYRPRFDEAAARVSAQLPQVRFLWIDIEDEADLIDPIDVEDFPTLLLVSGKVPRFFGALRPQAGALERLIRVTVEDAAAPALTDPQVVALVQRIRAEKLR